LQKKKHAHAQMIGWQKLGGLDASGEANTIKAKIPKGIPDPAQSECPRCFHAKEFPELSDWTEHVYEDLETLHAHLRAACQAIIPTAGWLASTRT
jgi:hypothetical protein